jgi:hypothetical protein
MQQEAQLTKQATTCLMHAHKIIQQKNQDIIHGDDLLAGVYSFIKEGPFADIFFNLLGRKNHEILEDFFTENNTKITTKTIKKTTQKTKIPLTLHKNIHTQIQAFVNKSDKKLDFITLFHVSLFDLSSELIGHINGH